MLIDLDFNEKDARDKGMTNFAHVREFDASNGGLRIVIQYGTEIYEHHFAVRLHKGVCDCGDIGNIVKQFTKWNFQYKNLDQFGLADNFKQIMKFLRKYIRSENLYVLGLTFHTQETSGGMRWHKHGCYIGVHKERGEYLRDTPEIKSWYSFSLVELK